MNANIRILQVDKTFVLEKCSRFVDFRLWMLRSDIDPDGWLQNFQVEEQEYAYHLLNSFLFFSNDLVRAMFLAAFQNISCLVRRPGRQFALEQAFWRTFCEQVIVTYVTGETPNPTDSGFIFARMARQYLGIDAYGRGTKHVNEDRGLIRYLMRHQHTTPFEMLEIKLHVKLPIFVARQWIRHRTANVNEYSARYSILDREFYVPATDRLAAQSATNRQGRGEVLGQSEAKEVLDLLRADAERNYLNYEKMLNEGSAKDPSRKGLARELARINLTLSTYTQWYWKIDLHNLLHFVQLRADPHAQYEIRAYAEELLKIIALWAPIAYEAFVEFSLCAFTLSRTAISAISRLLAGERVTQESSGLPAREWRELAEVLRLE